MNVAITDTRKSISLIVSKSTESESAYMFPPFPQVPSGTTIVPFSEFQERGIRVVNDTAAQEVDGFGIPTVALPSYHDLSDIQLVEPEQHFITLPYERFTYDGTVHGQKWWLAWEHLEKTRTHVSYNPRLSRMDRIYAAASSFRNGRRWPFERPGLSGPRYLWDQFCIFIGTLGYPPAWDRTDKPKVEENQADYTDEEDIPEGRSTTVNNKSVGMSIPNGKKQITSTRPPYAYYDVKPLLIDSDEAVQSLLEMDRLKREERLIDFLDDPKRAVKVFFSFYMRDQGLMWLDRNLDTAPRVVMHFFKYLLNNRVFPENECKLQDALKVIERSLRELPLTSIISKFLPDDFGKACRDHWNGQRAPHDLGVSCTPPHDETEVDITKLQEDCDEISFTVDLAADRIPIINPDQNVRHLESFDTFDLFKQLLTPTTAFPSTHGVGYVEQSVRKITQVLYPGTFFDPYAQLRGGTDQELEAMLAKLILAPWLDSGLDEYDQPRIIKELGGVKEDQLEPHVPTEDEIAVLVSVSSNNLTVLKEAIGMGLAGIWVQVRPANEKLPDQRRNRYWYIDSLDVIVPSYWTC